jgi:hypothetical protein
VAGLIVTLLVTRWDDLVSLPAPVPRAQAVTPEPAGRLGHPNTAAS